MSFLDHVFSMGGIIAKIALVFFVCYFSSRFKHEAVSLRDKALDIWDNEKPLRRMFLGLICVATACHFFRLGNFLLSIDDEYAAARTDPSVWIAQGRWTIYWVERVLLSQPTLPFFPDALFCLLISLSYLFVIKSHRITPSFMLYCLFPLYCCFPSLTVLGEFYANIPSVGIGFFFCSLAVVMEQHISHLRSQRDKRIAWLVHALCVSISIGCYQSFVLVYAVMSLGAIMCNTIEDGCVAGEKLLRQYLLAGLRVCLCFMLYWGIQRLHAQYFSSNEAYINGIMRFDLLLANPLLVSKLTFTKIFRIYGGAQCIYGKRLVAFGGVMIWGLIGLVTSFSRCSRFVDRVIATLYVCSVFCIPGLFLLVSGGYLPLRTFVAIPYVFWLFALFAQRHDFVLRNLVGTACVLLSVFQVTYLNNLFAAEMTVTQQRDKSFAAEIYQRLEETRPDFALDKPYRVEVFGMMPRRNLLYPTDISSTTAGSFFTWDGGNPVRMVYFMNLLGYDNITPIDNHDRAKIAPLFGPMPVWPAKGSVAWHGNTALVKLGVSPGALHVTP